VVDAPARTVSVLRLPAQLVAALPNNKGTANSAQIGAVLFMTILPDDSLSHGIGGHRITSVLMSVKDYMAEGTGYGDWRAAR